MWEAVDQICADSLESGDTIMWNGELISVVEVDDLGEVMHVLYEDEKGYQWTTNIDALADLDLYVFFDRD